MTKLANPIQSLGVAAGGEAGRVAGPAGGGLGHQEQHQPGQHRLRQLRGPALSPPKQLAGGIVNCEFTNY